MVHILHCIHVHHANELRDIHRAAEDPAEDTDADDERINDGRRYGPSTDEAILIIKLTLII